MVSGSEYWPTRVAVVEDHVLQRKRVEELLGAGGEFDVVFSAESLAEFVDWLRTADRSRRPQLLVLDLMFHRSPPADPSTVADLVGAGLRIVVLSALASPPLVQQILRAGVSGIVGKRDSEEDFLAAVRAVVRDGQWMTGELASVIAGDADRPKLSAQEERALVLYASGLALDAVAQTMGISPDTAKQYLARVKEKYAAVGRPASTKLELYQRAVLDSYVAFPTVPDRI